MIFQRFSNASFSDVCFSEKRAVCVIKGLYYASNAGGYCKKRLIKNNSGYGIRNESFFEIAFLCLNVRKFFIMHVFLPYKCNYLFRFANNR